ncbi:MAG: hypothetical protein A3C93_03965 [Candidatus Lloydbacteria bacterium RIFCSPHIGHO2_02_FULL_54_17]|uniref:Uncharacterized protein n=1 Tax=Candidatus Lloydbacteria bacterium RIFCSPHIGHO2_02_FULL_54_17 TaxID=1798664 RepID=A0A1G2DHH8_9BACT|nr:MAG: hypothetical protein A2762_03450 [Candidatus Lloydbacteria bacterium RIFCSPHIGHO2_01_FULL_54_11]OGZ12268.1 MAG: hypothetical protein A3C93_03965 [Candidatus Lloydbacteria bacterium RIFCSPHIGHO2_02_FULL_54_17]OGZ13971.1 MAG: hypothetical protein A2948_00615 [Candidatus Lloydbacteria bacterium RIFCSPLOWO2_01_FULL_54_18]OGZ16424.1 MAG: hypothetical protein A3H76_05365 [Candidatus Lloydbacteria bacterium RIFCSPLOWO2_02_FULL_54_12]
MSQESPNFEQEAFNISDGMDPISVPDRITKENYSALFGNTLPEGLSPDIFEGGELHLER